MQRLHRGNGEQDAENAVVFAPVRHRIEMRAQEKRGGVIAIGGITADQVAEGVAADVHAGQAQPLAGAIVQAVHRLAEEGSRDLARLLGEAGDGVAAGEHLAGQPPRLVAVQLPHDQTLL